VASSRRWCPRSRPPAPATRGKTVGDRLIVSPVDLKDVGLDLRIPPGLAADLAQVPGVASVDRITWLDVGYRPDDWIELAADDNSPLRYPVQLGRAQRASLDRGEVLVGTGLARARSLRPGSMVALPTAEGVERLRVNAIWSDPAANGFEATVSVATMTDLYGPQAFRELAVVPEPGISQSALADSIRDSGLDPELRVWTPDRYANEVAAIVHEQLGPFRIMQRSLVGVVLVSTLATLLLVGVHRRRELAIVGAIGLSPQRLFRTTLVEAGIVGATGSALGLAASIALTVAIRSTLAYLYGITPPLRFSLLASLITVAVTVLTTVVGAAWPAWRIARLPPADALRYE
jgi:putative ABC transport system permease protein